MNLFRTFNADDPWPSNAWFNGMLGEAKRGRIASVGAGLELSGRSLSRYRSPRIWARMAGTGPAYGFAEVVPNLSGGFDTLSGGRTDVGGLQPAYEANAVAGLSGTYQRLRWSTAGDWRFQDIKVGQGGGYNVGGATIPSCFCGPIPTTLNMHSSDGACNFQMFESCTIRYQPTPSAFAALHLPDHIFTSYPEGFPDPIAGNALFYYYLTCQYNQFTLTRLYATSPYGSPYRDGVLYTWLMGGYGNSCTPFRLDYGTSFPGSDPSCLHAVTIDG